MCAPQAYDNELEDLPEFNGLTDFCDTFKLERGKKQSKDGDPDVVGEFKVEGCDALVVACLCSCINVYMFASEYISIELTLSIKW